MNSSIIQDQPHPLREDFMENMEARREAWNEELAVIYGDIRTALADHPAVKCVHCVPLLPEVPDCRYGFMMANVLLHGEGVETRESTLLQEGLRCLIEKAVPLDVDVLRGVRDGQWGEDGRRRWFGYQFFLFRHDEARVNSAEGLDETAIRNAVEAQLPGYVVDLQETNPDEGLWIGELVDTDLETHQEVADDFLAAFKEALPEGYRGSLRRVEGGPFGTGSFYLRAEKDGEVSA